MSNDDYILYGYTVTVDQVLMLAIGILAVIVVYLAIRIAGLNDDVRIAREHIGGLQSQGEKHRLRLDQEKQDYSLLRSDLKGQEARINAVVEDCTARLHNVSEAMDKTIAAVGYKHRFMTRRLEEEIARQYDNDITIAKSIDELRAWVAKLETEQDDDRLYSMYDSPPKSDVKYRELIEL